MKHAIEFQSHHANYLYVGPRKSHPHASAILVTAGVALIRLGKSEIPVREGQIYWLPSGCLNAVTLLQGAKISTFNFSVRSTVLLPNHAGFIDNTALLHAIAAQLDTIESDTWKGPYGRLLRCARDAIAATHPRDTFDAPLRDCISAIHFIDKNNKIDEQTSASVAQYLDISAESLHEQLTVRHWVKCQKSGKSIEKIADMAQRSPTEVTRLLQKVAGPI